MTVLRYLTAGESHGPQLTTIIEGCPAGLRLAPADIDADLARRQLGFGRGARQQIERDHVAIRGGVRYGRTTGAPLALVIENRDAANWGETLSVEPVERPAEPIRVPRPGHADLAGELLYRSGDLRDVIERASARETAARTACGTVARRLLASFGCTVHSHVVAIGDVTAARRELSRPDEFAAVDDDPVRCLDPEAGARMQAVIQAAGQAGDTLGGVFEVVAFGYPAGVGSYAQADRRLGGRLAAAVAAVQAIKGVEIGLGFAAAALPGSRVHDEITWSDGEGYGRTSNHAGGIEGGVSTGLPIVVRAAMKPISTLLEPLASVTLGDHRPVEAHVERSDVCAVPAAAVVGEAVVAFCLAAAVLERFGGATVDELVAAVTAAREHDRRS